MIAQQTVIFSALAEPTRLGIIEMLLSRGELSAGQISEQFSSTAQAISQHLKVLREARLVVVKKRAQKHIYQINIKTITELEDWVNIRTRAWSGRLDAMDTYLQETNKR